MPTEILNSNKYGPATEKDVAEFEKQIKARLPEDYRVFLLEHNGGDTDPATFFINENQGTDVVNGFFSLIEKPEYDSLSWHFDCYLGMMPSNIIPIGSDPGGNAICISVSGTDGGSIYFWDHEQEVDEEEPGYDNLYLLADSFSEFMNKLYDDLNKNKDD